MRQLFIRFTHSATAEMLSSKVTGVEYHPVAINRVYKDAVKTE